MAYMDDKSKRDADWLYDEEMRRRRAREQQANADKNKNNNAYDNFERLQQRSSFNNDLKNEAKNSYFNNQEEIFNRKLNEARASGKSLNGNDYNQFAKEAEKEAKEIHNQMLTKGDYKRAIDMEGKVVVNAGMETQGTVVKVTTQQVTNAYKESDVHQGMQKAQVAVNVIGDVTGINMLLKQSAKADAKMFADRALGDNRDYGVSWKKDVKINLAKSSEELKRLKINPDTLSKAQLAKITSDGKYRGHKLTKEQLNAVIKHRNLLMAQEGINKSAFKLSDNSKKILGNVVKNNDVYQGYTYAKQGTKVVTKTANVAATLTSKVMVGGVKVTDKIVGGTVGLFSRNGKLGVNRFNQKITHGLNQFASASGFGKVRMGARAVGKVAFLPARGIGMLLNKTFIGRGFRKGVFAIKGAYFGATSKVLNSRLGQFVTRKIDAFKKFRQKRKDKKIARRKKIDKWIKNTKIFKFANKIFDIKEAIRKKILMIIAPALMVGTVIILVYVVGLTIVINLMLATGTMSSGEKDEDGRPIMQKLVDDLYAQQKIFKNKLTIGDSSMLDWEPSVVGVKLSTDGGAVTVTDLASLGFESLYDVAGFENFEYRTYYTATTTQYTEEDVTETEYFWKVGETELTLYNYYKDSSGTKALSGPITATSNGVSDLKYKKHGDTAHYGNPHYYFSYGGDTYYLEHNASDTGYGTTAYKQGDKTKSVTLSLGSREVVTGTTLKATDVTRTVNGPTCSLGKDIDGNYSTVGDGGEIFAEHDNPMEVNFEYKYVDKTGKEISEKSFYKALVAISTAGVANEEVEYSYLYDVGNYVFSKAMSNSSIDIEITTTTDTSKSFGWYDENTYPDGVPGHESGSHYKYNAPYQSAQTNITVYVTADFETLIGYADGITSEWHDSHTTENPWINSDGEDEWEGFYTEDGEYNDYGELAYEWYTMDDSDWADYEVLFPGNTYRTLTSEEIDSYIEQIRANSGAALTEAREKVIRDALSKVGCYYYSYASGHGTYEAAVNGSGLDCSGFVSLVLYDGGVETEWNPKSCSGLLSAYPKTAKTALRPGDLVIRNGAAGTSTTSENHVLIYAGKFDAADGTGESPRFIECTTFGEMSGTMISTSAHSASVLLTYEYCVNPFGD